MSARGYTFELVPEWGKLPAGWTYTQVAGVAVDSRDRVYVYNRGEHPVVVFDREGQFLGSWGEGLLEHAHGIFITPRDEVFLVDRFLQQVLKFTTDGTLQMAIGTRREPARDGTPFNHPTDVAVAPSGEIYVSDGYGAARVHKFAADGGHLLSWGTKGTGPGEFDLPHSVWVDGPERILVADRETHRIQLFTSQGQFIEEWGGFRQPTDFFLDRDGTLYVAELQSRVSILNREGAVQARLGGEESRKPGQFVAPHGVWTDSRGDLYVGEVLAGQRIQKFARRG
jgi:DNA-binding beta-propeller fold protein YncE